jgi:hypothetical protein
VFAGIAGARVRRCGYRGPVGLPETEITADLVRDLLRDQHPDLAVGPLAPGAPGWDKLVGDAGDHGRPGGKSTWGPPALAALRRLTETA